MPHYCRKDLYNRKPLRYAPPLSELKRRMGGDICLGRCASDGRPTLVTVPPHSVGMFLDGLETR